MYSCNSSAPAGLLFVNKSLPVSCSIIWKGVKSFLEFVCDAVGFIAIILHAGVIWVYWDFVMNCIVQELAMAPKSKQKSNNIARK